ncbi:MAG: hypothetical protein ACPG8V_05305 [Alphaproteobacteria bacterium]
MSKLTNIINRIQTATSEIDTNITRLKDSQSQNNNDEIKKEIDEIVSELESVLKDN